MDDKWHGLAKPVGNEPAALALNAHLHQNKTPYYMVNLDPAVLETPFGAHVDIRDTVNYREVMKQYSLGPNGGILTALNFFATRFEQVLTLIEKRRADHVARGDPLRCRQDALMAGS